MSPRKRVYTTSDTPGFIVAVVILNGHPAVKLLRQDGRNATEYSLTNKKRGTIFGTENTATDAAAKYCKKKGPHHCFVLPVGEREVNRVSAKS